MNEDEKKIKFLKVFIVAGIILVAAVVIVPAIAYTSDSYAGEFIIANKVYLNDGDINIVIYFNESSDTHYLIFEDWDASHSIVLSNMAAGENIKVTYRDYIFGVRTIVEIEIL